MSDEGCFDAGINPLTMIKELTREHVAYLVKMLRDFSMIFYNFVMLHIYLKSPRARVYIYYYFNVGVTRSSLTFVPPINNW